MNEIRVKFNALLKAHFHGKVVGGPGANWGIDLPATIKSKVNCYFDMTKVMKHPSISVSTIQVIKVDENLDPGLGIEQLKLDIAIRAEIERQGWSICAALEKELRSWMGTVNHERLIVIPGYSIDVTLGQPISTEFVNEGDFLIAYHVMVSLFYVRPQEV